MASNATVGTLNVEVALQLAKLQGDFDRMQNMVRNQTKASNRQFKEMGREGAAQLGSLRTEIEKTSKELARKFSGGKLIEGLLGGFGLGTGAAVVETVFRKFESIWKDSAEHAKTLEERSEGISKKMRELSDLKFSNWIDQLAPQSKVEALQKRVADVKALIDAEEAARAKAVAGMAFANKNAGIAGVSNFGMRVSAFEGEKMGGDTGMGGRDFFEMMLARADAAQSRQIDLRTELAGLEKDTAAAQKVTQAEQLKRTEKIAELTSRLADSQRAFNELAVDQTPQKRFATITDRVEALNKELADSRQYLEEYPDDLDTLKDQAEILDRLTASTRELAAARKDVAAAGEKAADDALRALRDREKMEKDFGEAMSKERQAIIDTKDRRNAGAGLLGQNAREGAAQSIERQQLTVLQRIEQLLARSPQVATPGAINLPRGFTF